jgi:quinol monooxygenase YgiN
MIIVVSVKYSVKPGTRDIVMEGARKYMAHSWTEKGCLVYEHLPSSLNDTDVIVYEEWETKEDLIAHMQAPEFTEFRTWRAPYMEGPPVPRVFEAVQITL